MADPYDLADVNPEFKGRMNRFLAAAKAAGVPAHVISGYRSNALQTKLRANYEAKQAGKPLPFPEEGSGGVAAKPGASYHNYGFAEDVLANDPELQSKLISLAADPQYGIHALGSYDPPHFQMAGDLAALRAQYPGVTGTSINAASAPVAGALASQETGPLDVRQLVYNKLTGAGLQPHQAMGAIWSLNGESRGLNPNAYNPNDPGGSVGFGQWMGPRRAALEAFAKTRGTAVTDPNTQADFLVDELTNKNAATYQPGVFSAMQGAKTAEDATRVWTSKFERPEKDNSDARIKAGVQAASLDDKGNFVLGPGVGANAPTTPGAAAAVAAAPAAEPTLWQKITSPQTDAQGNPVAGAKSPLQQMAEGFSGKDKGSSIEQFRKAEEEQAPEGTVRNQAGQAPGSRNTSPMGGALLPSVPQTYGQTLNSFSTPLTWNSAPPRAPQMPPAGLQGMPGAQIPGMTLTSFQAPQGIGYGVDPNIGYGYG